MQKIEEYLIDLIRPLLSNTEALSVVYSEDKMGCLLTIIVDKNDMGIIIGKQGETAKCIRHLVRTVGYRNGATVNVKINEPDGSPYRPYIAAASGDRALLDS